MSILKNKAKLDAKYNDIPTTAISEVSVQIIDISFIKSVDKTVWIDGNLTYTIVIRNNEDPGDPDSNPVTDVIFRDMLDINHISLIESSLMIGTNPIQSSDYDYNAATGELVIRVSDSLGAGIIPGQEVILSFQVELA